MYFPQKWPSIGRLDALLAKTLSLPRMLLRASYHLKEFLLLAEIYTGLKYSRLSLKVHNPKEPTGLINEPAGVFLMWKSPEGN